MGVQVWKTFVALHELNHHVRDYGHRLNPDYYNELAAIKPLKPERIIDLENPAVVAFFHLIDFPSLANEQTIKAIADSLESWCIRSSAAGIHSCDHKELMSGLVSAIEHTGSARLDDLLLVTFGVDFSSYMGWEHFIYDHSDAQAGGETCYRVKVVTIMNGHTTGNYEWAGLASSAKHILKVFSELSEGERAFSPPMMSDFEQSKVVHSLIYRNEDLVMRLPARHYMSTKPDWDKVSITNADPSILKALAGLAPEETISRLKLEALEDGLGM